MSNSKQYALTGACLKCTFGATPAVLMGISQQKFFVDKRLVLTEMDLLPIPPTFGICSAKPSPVPIPCVPTLTKWLGTSIIESVTGLKLLLKTSMIPCAQGGMVTITG